MADFQARFGDFEQEGIALFAFSTDPLEEARKTVEGDGLAFPVLWGVDGPGAAERLGAVYEARRDIIHPCAYILRGGTVFNATVSNGPVGRLTAADALGLITYMKTQ
ncbi:MAG: hypothetical protein C0617_06475 [Desulfuromonas sp.]|nr:MAG: hypothetical protein C0617_06475 [Desulfuromonas sp.]